MMIHKNRATKRTPWVTVSAYRADGVHPWDDPTCFLVLRGAEQESFATITEAHARYNAILADDLKQDRAALRRRRAEAA